MEQPPIAASEYDTFRRYLEDACGIVLGENKHYLVTSRLKRVTEEFSFPSLSEMMTSLVRGNDRHLREKVIDAAADINKAIKMLKDNYAVKDMQDLLAMTALQLASKGNDKESTSGNTDLLDKIEAELESLADEFKA